GTATAEYYEITATDATRESQHSARVCGTPVGLPAVKCTSLIIDGSFESAAQVSFNAGSFLEPGGWSVDKGQIDVQGGTLHLAHSGANSIDLNGTPGVGGLVQDVSGLNPAHSYKLSFWYADNQVCDPPEVAGPRTFDLWWDNGDLGT